MSTVVATHRLGGPIYQPRTPPPSAAIVVTMLSKPMNRAIPGTARLLSEDSATAVTNVSPFWGMLKRALPASVRERILAAYAGLLLASAAVLTFLVFTAQGIDRSVVWPVVFLAVFAAVAERQGVQIHAYAEGSVSVLPVLLAAVVLGPGPAILVALASFLFYLRAPFARWLIWTASRVIVAGLAGLVASEVADDLTFFALLLATVGAAVLEGAGSAVLASITVEIRHPGSFRSTLRATTRVIAATVPVYTPMVTVLAFAFIHFSPWTVLFFAVPALAAQRLLSLYQRQTVLGEDLASANARLEGASISFAGALVAALDARDQYTAGHSAAVAIYARDIAGEMRLTEHVQRRAHLAGLLHDIGKVGLPPGIIEKVGPLTPSERAQMEEHSAIGERILNNVDGFEDLALVVRHHHERFDGAGYPDCLRGEEIPVLARIISVADAYNAMTSGRPYRAALSTEEAKMRLSEAAGTQFDPRVVRAFEALLEDSAAAYLVAERADFAVEAHWRATMPRAIEVAA